MTTTEHTTERNDDTTTAPRGHLQFVETTAGTFMQVGLTVTQIGELLATGALGFGWGKGADPDMNLKGWPLANATGDAQHIQYLEITVLDEPADRH